MIATMRGLSRDEWGNERIASGVKCIADKSMACIPLREDAGCSICFDHQDESAAVDIVSAAYRGADTTHFQGGGMSVSDGDVFIFTGIAAWVIDIALPALAMIIMFFALPWADYLAVEVMR